MKRIRTQRAWSDPEMDDCLYRDDKIREWKLERLDAGDGLVPVLVIPEADVKGCKHDNETAGAFCPDCGSYRRWSDSRWQRPRILRVARWKK